MRDCSFVKASLISLSIEKDQTRHIGKSLNKGELFVGCWRRSRIGNAGRRLHRSGGFGARLFMYCLFIWGVLRLATGDRTAIGSISIGNIGAGSGQTIRMNMSFEVKQEAT
jgi:hypothetical protein